jgi:hypothetical protein
MCIALRVLGGQRGVRQEQPEDLPGGAVRLDGIPGAVHDDGRIRLLLPQDEVERPADLLDLRRVQIALTVGRRIAGRQQQGVAIAERDVEHAGEALDHLPAGLRPRWRRVARSQSTGCPAPGNDLRGKRDGPRTRRVIATERADDHPARVSLDHHDYVLEHLARQTLRQARAEAARHRRSIEAQRAREDTMSGTDGPDVGGIPRLAAPERITGLVALVIQPDPATILTSYDLADSLMPAGPEQVMAPGSLPHLTLTQCTLRDAPRGRVREFVARLDDTLRGTTIPLSAVVTFGAGFLFWCADAEGRGRCALQAAHEYAVTLADGLLDPVANEAVVEATARAFADEPELVANARRYG